jgi:hypothetical protein
MGPQRDAKASSKPATMQRYEVSFTYVEPEYARHREIPEVPYLGRFEVEANDPHEAVIVAQRVFRAAATRSGVSWPREIRSTTCRLIPALPGSP